MSIRCENPGCCAMGTIVCTKCKQQGFSKRIDSYCSRACEAACSEAHKPFHDCVNDCTKNDTNIGWTITLALKELALAKKLPSLTENGTLNLYFFGCEEGFEDYHTHRFSHLFKILKSTLYPSLTKLDVLISGIGIGKSSSIVTELFRLHFRPGRAETFIPSLSASSSLSVLLQPGLSIYVDSWEPAFRLLVNGNFPTLVTGYSMVGSRLTTDSVFDERICTTYFLADIVVPTTHNPASYFSGTYRKMAFYFCFQGLNPDPRVTPLSRLQLQADNQKAFVIDLIYVAAEFDHKPSLSRRCEQVLKMIDAGQSPFDPMASMTEVDNYLMYADF